jgi:pimeloyl-ACP methyl ester carboxylesterase
MLSTEAAPQSRCAQPGARPDRTPWSASDSPNASRCSGHGAVPTCCCKPEPAPSTAPSGRCSSDGTRGWRMTIHPPPVRQRRREHHTLPHGPHPVLMQQIIGMVSGISPAGYAACAEALARADLRQAAESINLPVLIVGGAEDRSLPLSCSIDLARLLPAARYAVVDGAHLASIECAAEVNRLLSAFLKTYA